LVLTSVTDSPRTSLARVLEDLGSTLLELVHGDAGAGSEISGVVIHDPLDESAWPPRSLVFGIGVSEPDEIARLIAECGRRDCAALVLRMPVPTTGNLAAEARKAGVAVFGFTQGASWIQLAAMLGSLLGQDDVVEIGDPMLGGIPSGDLFSLANAIAALLDAPITIEDRNSRVLAFSGRQDEADASRVETILGRRVTPSRTRYLKERGIFSRLYRTDEPVYLEPNDDASEDFTVPRVALAVRAGDEILGSIWAAVRAPLSDERTQTFRDVGKLVALHLLRQRAGADVERRLRADLVGTALEGGPAALDAASQLGIGNHPVVVLALALADGAADGAGGASGPGGPSGSAASAEHAVERQRIADALTMYLTATHHGSAVALIGDIVYGIVPLVGPPADAEHRAARLAADFLERTGSGIGALIGIGKVSANTAGLPASREGALRALRVLRSPRATRRVASIDEVGIDALLVEVADVATARGDAVTGPVARLLAYDARHHMCLVDTLRAWLDAFGDVNAAAQAVCVHPNTFRYRLRRLAEIGGFDLGDADTRFSIMLQLRLLADG
jgi:hypothetical protein